MRLGIAYLSLLTTLALAGVCLPDARADVPLFDFEKPADLLAFHYEGGARPVSQLSVSDRFATSGANSLRFETPRWKPGMPEWPSFEADVPVANWTGCDRLVLDITNASATRQALMFFVTDSKVSIRSGLAHHADLPSWSLTRVVIPLAGLREKGVSAADVRRIHFFTERPNADMVIYIDRVTLLRAGERLPVPTDGYLAQSRVLARARVQALRTALAAAAKRVRKDADAVPSIRAWADRELGVVGKSVAAVASDVERPGEAVLHVPERADAVSLAVANLETAVKLQARWEPVRRSVGADAGMVVGLATSMEKVLPRGPAPALTFSHDVRLSLARNEKEALQVVVLPLDRELRGVTVRSSDLTGPGGARLPASSVEIAPVGYVRTETVPPYGSSHVGWWPDPILSFLKTVNIARGDAQSFWVRVRAPKRQAAGNYRGSLTVTCAGKPAAKLSFNVRVYDFAVPDRSPLDLAITFQPEDNAIASTADNQRRWRSDPAYPVKAWRKHRLAWADMLADHYITYDTLYPGKEWSPDFEVLQHLQKVGKLGRFNLAYYGPCPMDAAGAAEWEKSTFDMIKPRYEEAKRLGLLRHAYIYGCDEAPENLFPTVQRAVERIKAAFPDVEVMTTTYDHTFGMGSVIKSVDAWCPLTPSFDMAKAAKARAAGKQVWWYICCGPHHPYANMFVEYPAIDGRVLMGAQTAKYRPDGFLYYQISIWNSRRPISNGPFTDWDPRSWTVYHGDGSWTCVGPDGTPLSTIRLENFRDGLEDYAYARVLADMIVRVEAGPRTDDAWVVHARALLDAPGVAKSMTEYTRDPAVVYRWRSQMAEMIEEGARRTHTR